jgi:hypothetical protein
MKHSHTLYNIVIIKFHSWVLSRITIFLFYCNPECTIYINTWMRNLRLPTLVKILSNRQAQISSKTQELIKCIHMQIVRKSEIYLTLRKKGFLTIFKRYFAFVFVAIAIQVICNHKNTMENLKSMIYVFTEWIYANFPVKRKQLKKDCLILSYSLSLNFKHEYSRIYWPCF